MGMGLFPNKQNLRINKDLFGTINPPKRHPQILTEELRVEIEKLPTKRKYIQSKRT